MTTEAKRCFDCGDPAMETREILTVEVNLCSSCALRRDKSDNEKKIITSDDIVIVEP